MTQLFLPRLTKTTSLSLFLMLGVSFGLVLLLTRVHFFMNHDEIIVYSISQQPLTQLFDTIRAEPHPPGFYLLLHSLGHLLPTQQLVKMAVILTSALLYLIVFGYARSRQLLTKYSLTPGFLVLFSSFTFLNVISHAKQDSITVPLFLGLIFALLQTWQKTTKVGRTWVLIFILQHLLLLFGYVAFAIGSLLLLLNFTLQLFQRKVTWQPILLYLVSSAVLVGTYFYLFGAEQILANQGRFSWAEYGYNALLPAISVHLTGFLPTSFMNDIVFFIFMALVGLSLSTVQQRQISKLWYGVVAAISAGLLLLYVQTALLVQARYGIYLFGFISIVAGWGLLTKSFSPAIRVAILSVLYFFAVYHFIAFELLDRNQAQEKVDQITEALTTSPDRSFGLIFDHSLGQHAFRLQYFPTETRLQPLNPAGPVTIFQTDQITYDQLRLDAASYTDYTAEHLTEYFQATGLNNFIYYANMSKIETHFSDPDKVLLQYLLTSCQSSQTQPAHTVYSWVFTNCQFID